MAVVKLGNKVKTNLPDMIRYVINPEKNDGGRLVYASYSSERHDANMLAEPMIRDLERCANLKEDKMGEVSLAGRAAEPVRLGEKEYFLLGDNRSSSDDSRFPNIGNVKREQILGKVWFRMLPLLKLGFVS